MFHSQFRQSAASSVVHLALLSIVLISCTSAPLTLPDDSGDADVVVPIDGDQLTEPDADEADAELPTDAGHDASDADAEAIVEADVEGCGDGECNADETCESCPDDCGVCPPCSPGGRSNFVVSVGHLVAGERSNWSRLGMYTFTCTGEQTGTVESAHWRFNQSSHRHPRELTGVWGTRCTPVLHSCEVRTAGTFATLSEPEEVYEGLYQVEGDTVTIVWSSGPQETWTVTEHSSGQFVRLEILDSIGFTTPPTHGWGYGSNAAYSVAASMAELSSTYRELEFQFEYAIWNHDALGEDSPRFLLAGWSLCEGEDSLGLTGCRTLAAGGGGCVLPVDPHGCEPGQSPMMYYLADHPAADRRNFYEFWTQCLADGRGEYCYTGNSHVRPLLQVIGDDGSFHGWVGVEASRGGSDVSGDYIGVFRMTDF